MVDTTLVENIVSESVQYTPRVKEFYDIGPVQRAAIESLIEHVLARVASDCTSRITSWATASDEQMSKKEYWQGYQHGCVDAIVEIKQACALLTT